MKKIGTLFGRDFLIDSEDPAIIKMATKWFEDLETREQRVRNKEIDYGFRRLKD